MFFPSPSVSAAQSWNLASNPLSDAMGSRWHTYNKTTAVVSSSSPESLRASERMRSLSRDECSSRFNSLAYSLFFTGFAGWKFLAELWGWCRGSGEVNLFGPANIHCRRRLPSCILMASHIFSNATGDILVFLEWILS